MNSYLEISGLTKRYGAARALEDVNLRVERGNVLALLGPNGAGKSTLFGCLLGLTQRTSGNIKEAAAVLGIDRSTLYEKIKKYEIPRAWRN